MDIKLFVIFYNTILAIDSRKKNKLEKESVFNYMHKEDSKQKQNDVNHQFRSKLGERSNITCIFVKAKTKVISENHG